MAVAAEIGRASRAQWPQSNNLWAVDVQTDVYNTQYKELLSTY